MSDKKKILLVDDDDITRTQVSSVLSDYDCTEASDARSALKIIDHQIFHLIILDVRMPEMDGFECARLIMARGYGTPIIFLTGEDTSFDKLKGVLVGSTDYITKPFSNQDLLLRVQMQLNQYIEKIID